MKISNTYPPNYEKITAVLNIKGIRGIIFTYGDTIYNPSKIDIPPDLMVHEEVHMRQQKNDPDKWWNQYLSDPDFRFKQELEAYRAQYKFAKEFYGRKQLRSLLDHIANTLSGPIYGNLGSPRETLWAITQD